MITLRPKTKSAVFSLFCVMFFQSCCAQEKAKQVSSVSGHYIASNLLDAKIDSIVKSIDMPGLSLAIVNDSKIAYYNTFGVVNSKSQKPVARKTIFEGASLSKPIFAFFALKMAEKGVLDLDRPLYEYLPHSNIAAVSKEEYKMITARMVLSHRSGFPNHAYGEKITLAFTPGTDFMYSGEGYQYLAEVIGELMEVGHGRKLNTLFQMEVTQPLNMTKSSFVWNEYLAKNKAYGHDESGNPTQNAPSLGGWNGETFNAYSSLHSEAREYANFLIALLSRDGLKDETFDEMFAEHSHFKDDNPLKKEIGQTGWGLGMAQKPTAYGMMHMHTGNNHDFQSYMMVLPEKKFGIVFFTNSGKAIPFIQGLNSIIGPIF